MEKPDKITIGESIRSTVDFIKVIGASALSWVDTKLANAINSEEDEL